MRRDVILSVSHFTTHRNHPTEDDYQDPSNGRVLMTGEGEGEGPEVRKGHQRLMAEIVKVN